ncbi:hypothetical protein MC885_006413 [Smutsia gigantea]|nr:hypothetical protein MC885_006413 [Smutsia gigantea]
MRYNEKELQALSRQPAELAAELGMRGPRKGSVVKRRLVKLVVNFLFYFRTDEAEPVGALLLEHCRITQEEPSGFSISECRDGPAATPQNKAQCREQPHSGWPPRRGTQAVCAWPGHFLAVTPKPPALSSLRGSIAFSGRPAVLVPVLSFLEDPERKYHFECRSEDQCQEWMGALRRASYEFMRRSLIFYRNEIRKMTGRDPLEQFGISQEARFQLSSLKA